MSQSDEEEVEDNIGMATYLDDGRLQLMLVARTDDGLRGEAMYVLDSDDPRYQVMMDHLGEFQPGESKLIPPLEAP